MATWNGTSKNFTLERWDPKDFGYSHYEDVEFNWSYNTTSDTLIVIDKDSFRTREELYSKDEAEALLHTLAQWYGRYEGKYHLKELLKDILKEDE